MKYENTIVDIKNFQHVINELQNNPDEYDELILSLKMTKSSQSLTLVTKHLVEILRDRQKNLKRIELDGFPLGGEIFAILSEICSKHQNVEDLRVNQEPIGSSKVFALNGVTLFPDMQSKIVAALKANQSRNSSKTKSQPFKAL